jgi:hypothetical protein
MRPWQYHFERIGHPITRGDAEIERSVQRLQEAFQGQQRDDSKEFLEDAVAQTLGLPRKSVGSAEDRLNELGLDGWELVSIFVDSAGPVAVLKKQSP